METVRPSSPTDPELAGLGAEGGAVIGRAGSESRVGLGAAWEDTAGVGAVLTLQDLLLLSHLSRV